MKRALLIVAALLASVVATVTPAAAHPGHGAVWNKADTAVKLGDAIPGRTRWLVLGPGDDSEDFTGSSVDVDFVKVADCWTMSLFDPWSGGYTVRRGPYTYVLENKSYQVSTYYWNGCV